MTQKAAKYPLDEQSSSGTKHQALSFDSLIVMDTETGILAASLHQIIPQNIFWVEEDINLCLK